MKAKEIKEMDASARSEKLKELRQELFGLRFQHATAQLENTQRLVTVKKDIARVMTVMNEETGA